MNTGEEFLEHFGVKGQKWGVRRQGTSKSMSPDASRHATNAKKSVKELSDAELRDLVSRINMEQQAARLNTGKTKKGHNAVKNVLATGATVNAAVAFARSPAGKAIGSGLATAATAALKIPVSSIGVTK